MTPPWEEITLPTILARYQLKDIFHADEFGLFLKVLPSKSLHFRGKYCLGGKHSKVWLTGMAALNALGERIPIRCLWLESLSVQDASSTFATSLAVIHLKRKHGWMGHFLVNGCTCSSVSSKCMEKRLLWWSIIALLIQKFQGWKLSIYSFCYQLSLPVYSRWIRR